MSEQYTYAVARIRALEVSLFSNSTSAADLDPKTGLLILAACLPIGIVGLISGKAQGQTAAAAIGIVAKKPDQFGKAMLFPAMVETYAILALLISILSVTAIQV